MDNKITCPNHDGCEKRLCKMEERFDELKEQFWEKDKHFEVMYTEISSSLSALSGLPKAISEMTTTMVHMQDSITDNGTKTDELTETVNKLSGKVEEIDNRDKVSIAKTLKDNWLTIAAILGCVVLLGKDILSNLLF